MSRLLLGPSQRKMDVRAVSAINPGFSAELSPDTCFGRREVARVRPSKESNRVNPGNANRASRRPLAEHGASADRKKPPARRTGTALKFDAASSWRLGVAASVEAANGEQL
eukprot:scaffold81484_cov31-Tisochrysis_lutea.AAC.1